MRSGRRGAVVVAAVLLTALSAIAVVTAPSARAAVPPTPLLWQRTYVQEYPQTDDEVRNEIVAECANDLERGLRENTAVNAPRIATLGDSVQSQMRPAAMGDPAIHWMYGSHCGEKLSTAVDSGRASDAVNSHPDALVIGLGGNDLSEFWTVRPDYLPAALDNLQRLLDATDGVSCRVMYTLPEVAPFFSNGQDAAWIYMTQQINAAIRAAAQTRPGFYVADWAQKVAWYWPAYLQDGMHLTRYGINQKMNLAIETARRCWAPDTPDHVGAIAGNGTATVWWDPLPEQERAVFYRVTASPGGAFVDTTQPTVNFPGLANGTAYTFTVQAVSWAGVSTPSAATAAVVPSAVGARFAPSPPVRVLDTRYGTGGKGTPFGPGESYTLNLNGVVPAGASAVVLNVTATGQDALTFITVWPGGQSRPLSSNLNPRPGVDAVPAMVTTRVSPNGTIQLFNNSGNVHLIADVIGWYLAPGDTSGALFSTVAPTRVLDTRDGTGGKTGPFGTAEEYALGLPQLPPGASAAVLNVTATAVTAPTHITVWPDGVERPLASSLNPQPGLTRANLTVSKVGTDGKVRIYNNAFSTDLIVDLVGYYTAPGAVSGGATYFPITPERVYDTRDNTGGVQGPVAAGSSVPMAFAGKGAIPGANVTAIDANVTVVFPSASGHTTIWPSGTRPTASNLNFVAGDVIANRDPIALSSGGALFWSVSSTDYVVDAAGWFGT